MSDLIRVEGLSKHYHEGSGKELKILREIDHVFVKGKTTSIVGSSGSGKSTFLNLLCGLDHPTHGKVFFEDLDIFSLDSNKLSNFRNQSIGFVFQAHHLLPDFSAVENVMIPGLIAGKNKNDCLKRAKNLLDQVGLQERAEHKPGQLSGGEQQRVAIARALLNDPELILADEPTGNLDLETGQKVSELLLGICNEKNSTLILVTHNPQLADKMEIKLKLIQGTLSKVVPDNQPNPIT